MFRSIVFFCAFLVFAPAAVSPVWSQLPAFDLIAEDIELYQIENTWHVSTSYRFAMDENVDRFSYECVVQHYRDGILLDEMSIQEDVIVLASGCSGSAFCEASGDCRYRHNGRIYSGTCVDHPSKVGGCLCSSTGNNHTVRCDGQITGGLSGDEYVLRLYLTSGPSESSITNNAVSVIF